MKAYTATPPVGATCPDCWSNIVVKGIMAICSCGVNKIVPVRRPKKLADPWICAQLKGQAHCLYCGCDKLVPKSTSSEFDSDSKRNLKLQCECE